MAGEYIKARFTVPSGVTLSATNGGGGPTSVSVTDGDYYIDDLCTELQTQLNASRPPSSGSWAVGLDTSTGKVSISCTGTYSITWTSTNLRDMLGFAANLTSVTGTQTSPAQSPSVWFPQCGINLDGDPMTAPPKDDGVASESPTGDIFKVAGVISYRLRNIRFTHVPREQTWQVHASAANADYETWYLNTQAGQGHTWFSPASACRVYWDNAGTLTQLGNGNVDSWKFPSPQTLDELALAAAPWTGYVTIVLGDARSTG